MTLETLFQIRDFVFFHIRVDKAIEKVMADIEKIHHSEIKNYLRQNNICPSSNLNLKDGKSVVDYLLKNSNLSMLIYRCRYA